MGPVQRPVILTGARVRTMVRGDAVAHEAIGFADGRVVAVGNRDDVRSAVGSEALEVDLDGVTVLPGLVDTHPHLLHFSAIAESLVDLADATSHAEIVERIRARAQHTPAGQWIMTTPVGEAHYFIRRSWRDLDEGELPDRHVLDRATSEHPVWIQAWAPSTPNVTAFNSAGLAAIGVDRSTPDQLDQAWIGKDEDGEPTGIIHGSVNNYYNDNSAWWDATLEQLPLLTPDGVVNGTLRAMREYNARGVTTVFEGHMMDFAHIGVYRALREQQALTVRVLATPETEAYHFPGARTLSAEQVQERLETALGWADTSDELLKIDGITLAVGGPCWPGMLRAYEDYRGPYGDMINREPFVDLTKSRLVKQFCAQHGLRLTICSGGDREHDEHLDQLEEVVLEADFRDQHWILQHGIHLTDAHVRRFADLGFDMTTSMSFSWGKGDLYLDRIGEQYLEDLLPLRRMLDAGVAVGCGSDWGPRNIYEHMALAVTHEFAGSGRTNRGPAQEVTREEAVAMWTREAARVLRWPGIGTLEPGGHADLVLLDRDPLTCDVDDLPGTEVLATYLGGALVHDAGRLGQLADDTDSQLAEVRS
ncbi:MAG TPA: amidohydrolase family protein [Nocardioidaceae bacterium]|nr:amidohydrolase family protein [Nocardioidaceae bacterium]